MALDAQFQCLFCAENSQFHPRQWPVSGHWWRGTVAADGVQKRGRGQELAVAQGAVQEKHLEASRLFRKSDSRSETEASGGRRGEQGQGGEEEERPEVALGDRFRLFIQTLNNA